MTCPLTVMLKTIHRLLSTVHLIMEATQVSDLQYLSMKLILHTLQLVG